MSPSIHSVPTGRPGRLVCVDWILRTGDTGFDNSRLVAACLRSQSGCAQAVGNGKSRGMDSGQDTAKKPDQKRPTDAQRDHRG